MYQVFILSHLDIPKPYSMTSPPNGMSLGLKWGLKKMGKQSIKRLGKIWSTKGYWNKELPFRLNVPTPTLSSRRKSEQGWVHMDYGVIKRVTNKARWWWMRQDGDEWGWDGDEWGVMNVVVMNEGWVVTNECRWYPPLSHHLTSHTVHINWCACHFCEVTGRWRITNPWVGCRLLHCYCVQLTKIIWYPNLGVSHGLSGY